MKTIFCINRKSVRAAQPPNKLVDRATEPELGLKDPKEKNFVEPEAEEEKTVVTPMPFTTNEANTVAILSSSTERPHVGIFQYSSLPVRHFFYTLSSSCVSV